MSNAFLTKRLIANYCGFTKLSLLHFLLKHVHLILVSLSMGLQKFNPSYFDFSSFTFITTGDFREGESNRFNREQPAHGLFLEKHVTRFRTIKPCAVFNVAL